MKLNFLKSWYWLGVLALVGMTSAAHAGEMVVSARFDHAYNLVIRGCNVQWQYVAGRNDISYMNQYGCLPQDPRNVRVDVRSDGSWDQPARIERLELPSRRNGGTLNALVVEPAGGSHTVTIRIRFDGYDQPGNPYPPGPGPGYPPAPGYPPGGGYGYINANPNPCYTGGRPLCTTYLQWDSGYRDGVVTVEIPGETGEKVFSCSGRDSGQAPWIAPGKRYVFRLYASNQCNSSVGRFSRAVGQVVVTGVR